MKKKLLIEALSTSSGGAIRHLYNLLINFNKQNFFDKVIVFLPSKTAIMMPTNKKILYKSIPFSLDRFFLIRFIYQVVIVNIYLTFSKKIDCIFVTGSSHFLFHKNIVTISQNLLPFSKNDVKKYFFSFFYVKLKILKFTQSFSFNNSKGVIFLHDFSRREIIKSGKLKIKNSIIIPHSVNSNINQKITNFKKFRIIYISNIDYYKNHDFVIRNIDGFLDKYSEFKKNLLVEFYGAKHEPCFIKIKKIIDNSKYKNIYKYQGHQAHKIIFKQKKNYNNIFLFASSCENFAVSLIEGMSHGLPIICAKVNPMKSVLKKGALFFSLTRPSEFIKNFHLILTSIKIRRKISKFCYKESKKYNCERVSNMTYNFLNKNSRNLNEK